MRQVELCVNKGKYSPRLGLLQNHIVSSFISCFSLLSLAMGNRRISWEIKEATFLVYEADGVLPLAAMGYSLDRFYQMYAPGWLLSGLRRQPRNSTTILPYIVGFLVLWLSVESGASSDFKLLTSFLRMSVIPFKFELWPLFRGNSNCSKECLCLCTRLFSRRLTQSESLHYDLISLSLLDSCSVPRVNCCECSLLLRMTMPQVTSFIQDTSTSSTGSNNLNNNDNSMPV